MVTENFESTKIIHFSLSEHFSSMSSRFLITNSKTRSGFYLESGLWFVVRVSKHHVATCCQLCLLLASPSWAFKILWRIFEFRNSPSPHLDANSFFVKPNFCNLHSLFSFYELNKSHREHNFQDQFFTHWLKNSLVKDKISFSA